jgi:hypothetical protein
MPMRHSHPRSKDLFDQISGASSRQERIEILKRERQFARAEFPVQLAKLESLLLQYNPFMVLVTFAFVDLTYLPEVGRAMSETGANQAVVILVDVELEHWPYSGMYLLDRKDLNP